MAYGRGEDGRRVKERASKGHRRQVAERDRGVCAECSIDTEKLRAALDAMKNGPPLPFKNALVRLGFAYAVKDGEPPHLWEMDHVVPLQHGGVAQGEDDLANLQTLCRWCHKVKTATEIGKPWKVNWDRVKYGQQREFGRKLTEENG